MMLSGQQGFEDFLQRQTMFDNCETFAYEESNKIKEKNEPLKLKLIILNI